ncbi:uncharacterized protein mslnb isoform X1 [Megalobrama amblycephala]|uniref:uncharacterized protein mslnb isoform X1 n=1 Tax=Megalobrama amblycephala TaxID=75352 RepID=UPI002013D374|nr:uncharacterized protein mslnb isoform X1 [Megalobrama amblycephala]
MRTPLIFPLLCVGVMAFGSICSAVQTQTCRTSAGLTAEQCTDMDGPTQSFLTCAGVPSEPDADHILNLKGLISAALDVYSFMRSSASGVPVLDLSGGVSLNEDHVIRAWLDIKLTPLLSSVSRNFLTCLSNRNFSCSAYQTVVKELSQHFSGLDPVRQKWIYSFFMYPFLSRNTSSGCVDPEDSTEDWLMKNFGSFAVVAQVRDFTSINMLFSGLEVLHLLSPEQKAELLLHPEVVGLTNSSLDLVFQSLLSSLMPSEDPWTSNNSTQYYMSTLPSSSPQDPLGQALNGFMTAFRPVGSFVREFVSLTQQQNLSGMRSATLLQAVINLTLAEIAAPFKQNPTQEQQVVSFDPMNINDWFTHVVSPILRRFLPDNQIEIHPNLTAVFHNQFYIETGMGPGAQNESQDICSVFIDNRTCGLTDLVEHVATVLHCATRSNLTLNEETLLNVLLHLSQNLNALLQQLSMTNFSSQSSPFNDILDQIVDDTFTMSNLQDESFVRLWFQVKLKPLLSTLTPEYLTCLSHKEFSCQTFQILISELSDNMFLMSEGAENVYKYFIFSFLSRQNVSGGCPAENSRIWVSLNLGEFSQFSTLREMYQLNQNFNAIDALVVLSPTQTAELIVEDFAGLPEKNVIINMVFDHILVPPEDRGLLEMLGYLIVLAGEMGLECSSYQQIVQRLQESAVPPHMMQPIKDNIDQLEQMAPAGCFPPLVTCISTPLNETSVCNGISSNETLLSAGLLSAPCSIDLQQYACSSLTGITAGKLAELLKCQLSSSSSYSKEIWKLLFTKTNNVLDGALVIFSSTAANMSQPIRGDVMSQVLDVIGELRLERISPDQWSNVTFISMLLGQYLKPFLPYASPSLLQCASSKNLSCQTYQNILAEFPLINETQGRSLVGFFILPFLSRNSTDVGCVSRANNNTDWLLKNFGLFTEFVTLEDLLSINRYFNPLETLVYLSPAQMVDLMVEDLPGLPQKEVIISGVFDHLLVSPVDRGLPGVLENLLSFSQTTVIQCSSLTLIFERLIEALPLLPSELQTLVFYTTGELKQKAGRGCSLPEPPTCLITPMNATRVCSGVNSNETLLSAGLLSAPCSIDLQQYACSSLTGITAGKLAELLKCQLSSSSSYSKEIWKLLFTKTNNVLDGALVIFSSTAANMSQPIRGDVMSQVLDVIGELRLERISPDQWSNVTFISMLLGQYLKPFLPYASPSLLQCASSKNLSCQTYQNILAEFPLINETQGRSLVGFFILPFLSRNSTDVGCVSRANNNTDWLLKNFGLFAEFVTLEDLLSINRYFNPLETLVYLSPAQMVELMVEDLPGLPQKEVIISGVFDHLLVSPVDRGLPGVLENLLSFSQTTVIQCSSLTLIFERLIEALPLLPSELQTLVFYTTGELKQKAGRGCSLPEPPTCLGTPVNATRVCSGVNSNETLLSAGLLSAPCSIDLQQYACSSLTGITAGKLAELLKCQLSSSSSYSKEIWKLLFTKTNNVLDGALVIFSSTAANMSQPIRGDVMSQVLDVIGELRLERISPDQWSNVMFISMLLGQYLKPFLPYASPSLLQCASSKNLSCQTYQNILAEFPLINETQGRSLVGFFILPFLSRNSTDVGCVSRANNNTDWLLKNFGLFTEFVTLEDLLSINRYFNPLETLVYLSPAQMVELMVEDLPGLPQKEVIINKVFDHLLVSPVDRGLPKVLELLYVFSTTSPLSCQTNQIIFTRLDHILRSAVGDLEPVIWASVYNLSLTAPTGCSLLPVVDECPLTPYNETQVCSGVDSSALQLFLNKGDASKSLCDFSIAEYACTPVLNVSVEQLLSVLDCHLSADVISSPGSWKLLLTRVSNLLDGALITLSKRSAWWSSSSGSVVLDVLRELRLDRLTDDGSVTLWLGERLRPFLPFASKTFLQCLRSKNFSCQNFQTVVEAFNAGFLHMNDLQRQITVTDFIVPFLSSQPAGAACVSDDSSQWLIRNFGQFSALVPLNLLISLNTQFSPLSSLLSLSPEQLVALMFDDIPGLPEKSVVINAVFDHLIAYPQELRIESTLKYLVESSKTRNISCASYQIIFHHLDHLMVSVSVNLETAILRSKSALLQQVPSGCESSSRQCGVTTVNETAVCRSVNSSGLSAYLASSHDGSRLCQFSITQYACAELTVLSAQDLVTVLLCSLSLNEDMSIETWKLFTQKVNPVLGPALDLLANTRLNKSLPSVSFLNMIGEVTLSSFSSTNLRDALFVQRWFGSRLRPFLPYASEAFLSCLSTRDFSCDTFRIAVQSFGQSFDIMSNDTQANVYVDFIKVFLSQNITAGCVGVSQNSSDWLISSFGRFSVFTTVTELQMLNPSFSVLDTLSLLSLKQLVEVSSTPGVLSSAAAVDYLLLNVPDAQFTTFFTSLSESLQMQGVVLPPPVQGAFLTQVFGRANLTTLSDNDLTIWILNILPSFITSISVQHVTTYFSVVQQRPCPISQQAVQMLSSSSSTFQPATQDQIYQQILGSLTGPTPLRCYGNQSYYAFLTSSFQSFQFPNLTTFLSLMPPARVPELMESMSPVEVSSLLNRPNAVDDVTKICQLFTNYPKTPQYLQTQPLGSVALGRQVLSCVWPQVLKVELRSEVDQWFDSRLVQYLPLLTSQFIGPDVMQYSSCLSFKKFVSVMSKYNFSAVEFSQSDVYDTILVYLNTSSAPKCYNTSNPNLNSTAWFVDYISVFLRFITLDDLLLFGSIQPFTVNLENLQLFSQISVPDDVMDFYVTALFEQNPSFSAYYLPVKFRCMAPASSFIQLTPEELKNVSSSIHQNCTNIAPDVSAALASSAEVLTATEIQDLGQSCTGLSTGQISSTGGNVLFNSLSVLSQVQGWNLDQAMMIIQTLLSSGVFQINSANSLEKLGSLIIGVETTIINVISGNVWLQAVRSQSFLASVTGAPIIVQQNIVSQIIAVNSSSDGVITNVPDLMATEIPRNFLLGMSSSSVQMVNQKKWKHEQAVLLFETVAAEFSDPDAMSFQVLQGFTCSRIQSFSTSKVMSLIRGCRQRVNQTLVLQESQLTCMYSYIKSADLNAFSQYPPEVLIYYNYSMIDRSLCRSYFASLGKADFSVLSSTLSFKKQILFNSAMECLGISGFNVTREQMDVLGSMCCFLSTDHIQNSDPYLLEKLKQCPDLSAQQISAVESVLLRGNTVYGSSNSWNRTTLENLEILPLYVTANIWSKFKQEIKQRFLKTFIRDLRRNDKASEMQILNMMNEVNKISRVRIKRSAETKCTEAEITQVQVYSDMFPFAYDVPQFNACLIVQTLKDNLEAITDRVYDRSYQRIVLDKLYQAYPDGLPDEVLQVLGSTSRAATPGDVRKWNVKKIDTLASLMNTRNGDWDAEMVQLLVSKYLSVSGNTLGTNELNALGGTNLCALTASVLSNITAASLERASALSLTNCSSEKKSILFSIALNAFSTKNTRSTNTVSIPTYQLLQNYLGGADSTFIRKVVNSAVNMDVPTFISLQQSVINVLNVTDVKSLLGVNVGDLKTYESTAQIQEWIRLQPQSDLNTLQIGLTGGRNATETTATTATTAATATSATKAPSVAATTAAASRVWAPVCLQLLLLAVTMTTLQLLH